MISNIFFSPEQKSADQPEHENNEAKKNKKRFISAYVRLLTLSPSPFSSSVFYHWSGLYVHSYYWIWSFHSVARSGVYMCVIRHFPDRPEWEMRQIKETVMWHATRPPIRMKRRRRTKKKRQQNDWTVKSGVASSVNRNKGKIMSLAAE